MGRKSTEIERDLERQRKALHARVENLEERLRSDAETTMDRLNAQRHRITDKVPDPVKPSEMREHPKSLLLGAFGAGLTAALVSERGGGGGGSSRYDQRRYNRYDDYDPYERSRRRDEGGSFTLGLIERTLGPAVAAFQTEATDYLEGTVRELFGSRNGGRRERSNSEESSSEDGAGSRATSRS